MANVQAAYLAPFLLVLTLACRPAGPVIDVPAVDSATAVSSTPAPPVKSSSTLPQMVDTPTNAGAPTASANTSSEVEASPSASRVVAETIFVHDGFRTEVSDTLEGVAIRSHPSSTAEGKQTVTVSLRNLSQSTGGIQNRATINFAPGLDNFVVLPTVQGPLTLYLHRTGALGQAPDTGGFT